MSLVYLNRKRRRRKKGMQFVSAVFRALKTKVGAAIFQKEDKFKIEARIMCG